MSHPYCFVRPALLNRRIAIAFCCLAIFAITSGAQAQSGRRASKSRTPPVATPAPPPEKPPSPRPSVAKTEEMAFSLYVCMSNGGLFLNLPGYVSESLRSVFLQRLQEERGIKVTAGENQHRTEAIKRAKAEESTHVVLLELETETMDARDAFGNVDQSKLLVRYTVFAPSTGKIKLSGRVYQQQYRAGRGGIGVPSTRRNNPLYSDYLLKEAARTAAERVLAEFSGYQPPRAP